MSLDVQELIRNEVERQLAPLRDLVRRMTVGQADSRTVQGKGFSAEAPQPGIEHWQHFGFASNPPAGTEIAAVKVGAEAEAAIGIAESNRDHRPTDLASGDAVLHSVSDGGKVYTRADGNIDCTPQQIGTCNCGGNSYKQLRGNPVVTAMNSWFVGASSATTVAQLAALASSILSSDPGLDSWFATKAKNE